MIFNTHTLGKTINPFVESIFHFKNFTPDHSIERVIPTGHVFIIFELDNIKRNTFDNDTLKPIDLFTKVWISGIHKNYISISAHQNSEMFVIQFKPYGAHPFLHISMDQITDKVIQGEKIIDGELISLRNAIYQEESSEDKFKIAEEWLLKRFDHKKVPSNDFLELIERLKKGAVSTYSEIIADYPKTQKHLIDQFKKFTGLTPKYFQRIVRFNDLLQHIQKKQKVSWPQIAYHCGYADQSHFIKEFKHFSGFNPQEFITQAYNQDEPNFFPLDRKG